MSDMTGSHSGTAYLQMFLSAAVLLGLSTASPLSGSSAKLFPLRSKQQTKASDGSPSYGPVSCGTGTPQVPNYIQPMRIEPKRILGKWYRSSEWYPGVESANFDRANLITTFSNLLNDSLTLYPGSNTPALAFEQLNAYYDLTLSQCANNIPNGFLEYATVDGHYRGVGFSDTASVDTTVVLSTDHDTYIVYYICLIYNVNSGICAFPAVIVDTRQPVNLVSSSTLTAINDAVNRVLAPYCFKPDMLRKVAFQAGMPDCPLLPPPTSDCYKSLRDAYRLLAGF